MPKLVLTEPFIEVDGVDLSCYSDSVEVNLSKAEVEANDFCGQDIMQGLEQSSFTINFHSSFGVGEVNDTLYPLWDSGDTFEVTVRPVKDDAVGEENPEFTGTARLMEYMPLAGEVGALAESSVTFPVIGHMAMNTEETS